MRVHTRSSTPSTAHAAAQQRAACRNSGSAARTQRKGRAFVLAGGAVRRRIAPAAARLLAPALLAPALAPPAAALAVVHRERSSGRGEWCRLFCADRAHACAPRLSAAMADAEEPMEDVVGGEEEDLPITQARGRAWRASHRRCC
jgi:hypothetical protein